MHIPRWYCLVKKSDGLTGGCARGPNGVDHPVGDQAGGAVIGTMLAPTPTPSTATLTSQQPSVGKRTGRSQR